MAVGADIAGVSTLGVKFAFGVESVVGTKPTEFKQLTRINSIGEISLSPETIDASALEDSVERSVAGRTSTGGTFDVVVNLTATTETEWKKLIEIYQALADGKQMWFEVWSPYLANGFFVVGQPPLQIPQPSIDQNGLMTCTMPITISDYKGLLTKVDPVAFDVE